MPCNYSLYHKDWKTVIRPDILKRDENKCKFCGVVNKSVYIIDNGTTLFLKQDSVNKNFYTCPDGYKRLIGRCGEYTLKQVVLTIAHLDHDINNNEYINLAALCQRCHLNYDKELHKETRKRNKLKKQPELF